LPDKTLDGGNMSAVLFSWVGVCKKRTVPRARTRGI